MIKKEEGFTLIELLITMAVFVLIIAAASGVFTGLLTQFKQQSRLAETNIQGIVGLEILRQDIEHAGYGLPWDMNGALYQEAVNIDETPWDDSDFNDGPPDNPARGTETAEASNPPGGIRSGNGYGLNESDVLVIKAINISNDSTAGKWTTLKANPSFSDPYNPRQWTPTTENLTANDNVIVISPGTSGNERVLVTNGTSFSTKYSNLTSSPWKPSDVTETRLVYGVSDSDVTSLRMPFNRADYYVREPDNMPQRCAPNTGILYKATVNHSDGRLSEIPLLDCVADMQVIFGLDNDGDGDFEPSVSTDGYSNDISSLTAQQIRDQVREVRVYILAHEGQRDINYTYPNSSVTVGEFGMGSNFNLASTIIENWQNYRWKIYTLTIKPKNLG